MKATRIAVRLDAETRRKVALRADAMGLAPGEWVRAALLAQLKRPPAVRSADAGSGAPLILNLSDDQADSLRLAAGGERGDVSDFIRSAVAAALRRR